MSHADMQNNVQSVADQNKILAELEMKAIMASLCPGLANLKKAHKPDPNKPQPLHPSMRDLSNSHLNINPNEVNK